MRIWISLIMLLALDVSASTAQQKNKIAGKMTFAVAHQANIGIDDTEDHIIFVAESDGTNANTGPEEFMDSAQVTIMQMGDRVKGSGNDQGYAKFALNGDAVFLKWTGKVTTTVSAKGSPVSTADGTFSFVKGTGKFEKIQGGGTYRGKPLSRTISTADWEGEYVIGK